VDQDSVQTRLCPFCKEEVNVEAIKCKHCRSFIQPEKTSHGGICPFCMETIMPEAIVCKHCGSNVGMSSDLNVITRSGMSAEFRSRVRNVQGDFNRTARRGTNLAPTGLSLEEICGPCEVTTLDLGSYTIVFEDQYCCTPFETIGSDGQVTLEYLCHWKMCREPHIIYHEAGPIPRDVIGGNLTRHR
jgi:hypothetical protein